MQMAQSWQSFTKIMAVSLSMVTMVGARACLNDRDSIEYGYGDREVMLVATGWFPQNPPEFYELRIKRLLGALKTRKLTPSEYDDISVAYDRLGNDDEALSWIQKKGSLMNHHGFDSYRIEPADQGASEPWTAKVERANVYQGLTAEEYHQYSLHANWGTFLIHRWIRTGMPLARIEDAKQASSQLGQAIDINPDAHSGREIVQLAIVDWLVDIKSGGKTEQPGFSDSKSKTLEGLAGLVELGAAWSSYDVFALMTEYSSRGGQALAYFRAQELLASGVKPLTKVQLTMPDRELQERYRDDYKMLRRTAKSALSERWEFMRLQFAKGLHPDTDPNFWLGYFAPARPTIFIPWPDRLLAYGVVLVFDLFGCVWIPMVAFFAIRIVKGRRTRKSAA